jgi:hypothetical protein
MIRKEHKNKPVKHMINFLPNEEENVLEEKTDPPIIVEEKKKVVENS